MRCSKALLSSGRLGVWHCCWLDIEVSSKILICPVMPGLFPACKIPDPECGDDRGLWGKPFDSGPRKIIRGQLRITKMLAACQQLHPRDVSRLSTHHETWTRCSVSLEHEVMMRWPCCVMTSADRISGELASLQRKSIREFWRLVAIPYRPRYQPHPIISHSPTLQPHFRASIPR